MIDRKYIGYAMPVFSTSVDVNRLKFFAKAIGQLDPIYIDEMAAHAAGHPTLPIPPTFLLCMEGESPNPAALRNLLGIDYQRLLHGEQGFTYHRMAYAGEVLSFEQRIDDIYDKKGGALEFVVRKTRVSNQRAEHIADLRSVLVMRSL
jgi:acyl dehydratase